MLTGALIASGFYGDDGHQQRLDSGVGFDEDLIVWRRSVPHGQNEQPLVEIYDELIRRGYGQGIVVLVIVRDIYATARSQVRTHSPRNMDEAYNSIAKAMRNVIGFLMTTSLPFHFITYESLLLHPQTLDKMLRTYGLRAGEFDYFDANLKWYRS